MKCEKTIVSDSFLRCDNLSRGSIEALEKLKDSDRAYLNEAFENNYQRGFHQAIAAIKDLMDEHEAKDISIGDIIELLEVSGEMRYKYENGRRFSYFMYSDVFIEKAKKSDIVLNADIIFSMLEKKVE